MKRSNTGLGLFAARPFKKGERVAEYIGRALSNAEMHTSRSKYLFEINSRKMVDGAVRENIARYINHSCRPNCEAEVRRGRIYISAIRNIKIGEEFSYDYGEEYVDEHIKPRGCRCRQFLKK